MSEPAADNLRRRQFELNDRVAQAFEQKTNFDEVKLKNEESDVDRLFKIDLASLYKNIDYICDTLKSGDSLYISRALKCIWIYDDEYKYIINPDNLHQNIFPFMSTKMKKKMLSVIAVNLKDPQRANDFYEYCIKIQLDNIAIHYLHKIPESSKKEYIKKHKRIHRTLIWEHFFGDSIDVIEFYLEKKMSLSLSSVVDDDLYKLRYLFSYSPEAYLNIFEKYSKPPSTMDYHNHENFGLRMSKEIMKKHKSRVLEKPLFYLWKINPKMLSKYTSCENAKVYLRALLPPQVNAFWEMNFYDKYIKYFELTPLNEVYQFLRQIFTEKYPGQPFEMNIQFYHLKYHELLTSSERHDWALKHIQEKKELLGAGQDFLWYRYVNFDITFGVIKKLIYKTTCQNKRAEMIEILVDSASEISHFEKLILYYHDRHMNEHSSHKDNFIDRVIEHHNVFEFTEKCWDTFYKLLHSVDMFDRGLKSERYKKLVLIYNIINKNEYTVPTEYEDFCEFRQNSTFFSIYIHRLDPDQKEKLYQCFMNYFLNKIKEIIKQSNTDNQYSISNYVKSILTLMEGYKKSKEEIPEMILYCVNMQWHEFHHFRWFQTHYEHEKSESYNEAYLIRLLKKDTILFFDQFKHIRGNHKKIKTLLSKIRIYFADELARDVLTFFEVWLGESLTSKRYNRDFVEIIYALFELANDKYKIDFMSKYAPKEPKIQHGVLDKNTLRIQTSICRTVYYSRPPVPLENVLQYVKGDYVSYCLPMFNSYLMKLPIQLSLQFTEAVLNSPVSTQKHGLRLAFQCYNSDNLSSLISDVWQKTKNISLRTVIFKSLHKKIQSTNDEAQSKLFEILTKITQDLDENDEDDVFGVMISMSLPENLRATYFQTAWTTIQKLSDESSINVTRKTNAIRRISSYIRHMDKQFCLTEIIDSHIQSQLLEKRILYFDKEYGMNHLIDAKWELVSNFITHFDNKEQLNDCFSLVLIILDNCCKMWNNKHHEKYIIRAFLQLFVNFLIDKTDSEKDKECKPYIVPLYEKIIEHLEKKLSIENVYCLSLTLKILILGRNTMGIGKINTEKRSITYDHLSVTEVADKFASGIIELLSNKEFFPSFYADIAKTVGRVINIMTDKTEIKGQDLTIAISHSLTKFNLKEAYLLAAHILPTKPLEDIKYALCEIQAYEDIEVKSYVYQKFIVPQFNKIY